MTKIIVRIAAPTMLALFSSGCWSTLVVNGKQVSQTHWESSKGEVVSQASFATGCPVEQLTLTLLSVEDHTPPLAEAIGVEGCGKKMVYRRIFGTGWVANTSSSTSPQAQ